MMRQERWAGSHDYMCAVDLHVPCDQIPGDTVADHRRCFPADFLSENNEVHRRSDDH
jgi:hypothetical protein